MEGLSPPPSQKKSSPQILAWLLPPLLRRLCIRSVISKNSSFLKRSLNKFVLSLDCFTFCSSYFVLVFCLLNLIFLFFFFFIVFVSLKFYVVYRSRTNDIVLHEVQHVHRVSVKSRPHTSIHWRKALNRYFKILAAFL